MLVMLTLCDVNVSKYKTYLQETFNEMACEANGLGFRLEIHAIGDAAADLALTAIQHAKVAPQKRTLLTHCQV